MIILGIDPGLADLGYGVIDYDRERRRFRHLDHGVVKTSKADTMARRLDLIYRNLRKVIDLHNPTVAAVESLFFARNVTSALAVAQARGAAILATAQAELEFVEFTPLEIKLALVGYGRANKMQVQQMVKAVLALEAIPKPDHAADALAVAICHAHSLDSLAARSRSAKFAEAKAADALGADAELTPAQLVLAQRRTPKRRRR